MRIPGIALLLAVAGCASLTGSGDDLRIIPEDAVFSPNEQVTARFINDSRERVGYGACSLFLEVRVGGDWEPAAEPPRACIGILYVLEPGESEQVALPPRMTPLPEGRYRLRQEFMPGAVLPSASIWSEAFEVRD